MGAPSIALPLLSWVIMNDVLLSWKSYCPWLRSVRSDSPSSLFYFIYILVVYSVSIITYVYIVIFIIYIIIIVY